MRKINDGKTPKQRYFDKVYKNAPLIKCACGCGKKIKNKDKYGRDKKYISGHNNRIYDDPTQHKREWNHRNRKARYEYKKQYHRKRKVDCIYYKGGKCIDCGLKYNGKNACVFQMHHRDPKEKDFAIGNKVVNKAWTVILAELDKCDLLCSNCHDMRHSAEF